MKTELAPAPPIAAAELEQTKEPLSTLEVLKQRRDSGYERGSRSDGNFVAIALGPGGWAGEVSIGEYRELDREGLADQADILIGSSVGGLIATYMATKQFRDGLDVFLEFMPKHGRVPKMETLMEAVFKKYPIDFDKLPKDLPIVIALTDLDKFGTKLVRSDQVDPREFEELSIRGCHQAYVGGKPPVLEGQVMKGTTVSDSALSLPNTVKMAELISDQYPDLQITHLLSLENIRQAKDTSMNRAVAVAMNRPLDAYIRRYDPAADPKDVFTASLSGGQFSDIRAYKQQFEGPAIGDVFTTKSEQGHEIVVERVYPAELDNLPGLFLMNLGEKGIRKLRAGYDAGRIAMLERISPGLDLTTSSRTKNRQAVSTKPHTPAEHARTA